MADIRVMGVDTSLRSTGIGIVESVGSKLTPVHRETIKTKQGTPLSVCLVTIQKRIAELVESFKPGAIAIESVFYAKNVKTAMLLCHARGVVISQCSAMAIPVFEYEARRVKSAVVGYGNADKEQIQHMTRAILNIPELPQNDEADALALAITHINSQSRITQLAPESI